MATPTCRSPIRAILWWALRKDKAPLRSYSEGAKLGIPIGLALKTAAPIVAAAGRLNEATDENVRRGLAALPAMLQRIDDWIDAGVIGGEQPNIADFQIAPSLRLAMTLDDLRPAIEPRPAGQLALRLVPDYPGHCPPVLPPPGFSRCAARRQRRSRRRLQSVPSCLTRCPGPRARVASDR